MSYTIMNQTDSKVTPHKWPRIFMSRTSIQVEVTLPVLYLRKLSLYLVQVQKRTLQDRETPSYAFHQNPLPVSFRVVHHLGLPFQGLILWQSRVQVRSLWPQV